MSDAAILDDEQMLARLAALDLAAAERVHEKLMAAEEASEIAELGGTYQRLARSLRQTLILKAKATAERQQTDAARAKAAQRQAEAERRAPYAALGRRIMARVEPLIVEACERLDDEEEDYEDAVERLTDRLVDLIGYAEAEPGFLETPAHVHASRLCARLGLPPPPPEALLPPEADEEPEAADQEPAWRSSA